MSIPRIKIMLLHTWYHFTHSMETWVDLFWNSAIQMAMTAYIALFISSFGVGNPGRFMVMGMIFWNIIWVGQYAVTVGVLWEIWSKSFSSLFITPLNLDEFLLAEVLSGVLKAIVSIVMGSLIAYLIFGFNVLSLGSMIFVYSGALFIFALAMGMAVLSIIFRFGTDVQSLSWALIFLVQPLGAISYPVKILPPLLQSISWRIPTTYIFESMRHQLTEGNVQWDLIGWGYVLSAVYFISAYILLHAVFTDAKKSGRFVRMEG